MICREQVFLSVRAPIRRAAATGAGDGARPGFDDWAGNAFPDREGIFHGLPRRAPLAG